MSQENVELIQAGIRAWNAQDAHAVRELHHPDAIGWGMEDWPERGPFVGRDAVLRWYEQLRATFERDWFEPLEPVHAIADRVVARVIWHGVGQGPPSDLEVTFVYSVRKGEIRSVEVFRDHTEALEAVGLSE